MNRTKSLGNQFGNFSADGKAFTITDPGTPMPWVNVICTGRYGLVISQNGGGFSWFDDAQHNVITRWEMDLVRDCYGKFLYLSDLDSGQIWSASPQPCRIPSDGYSCTHEPGVTTFQSTTHGIKCEWTLTVSPDHHAEVWLVRITNTTANKRRIRTSSYFEWCCNTAPDVKREFHRLFFNIQKDEKRNAILAIKNMWDIRPKNEREHWNRPWPYAAAHALKCDKFTEKISIADKEMFLGKYGSTATPIAMTGKAIQDGYGRFGDAVAALGGDLSLAAGETVEMTFTIAIGDNPESVMKTIDALAAEPASQTLASARSFWNNLLTRTKVSSACEDFDLLNNCWLPYQAISGRLWGRTGYYQQSGAFGFRDQLQDSQVFLPIDPDQCKKQIKLHAVRQFSDGSVYHWWHALADFGNHTACSDDYLWLPFVVAAYLRETGDYAILDEVLAFVDDPKGATLKEHCRRSIARTFKRTSDRGLPHIGSCDWNDGLSAMGIDEKGESVWLAMFLCTILDQWETILSHLENNHSRDQEENHTLAAHYHAMRLAYAAAINEHAWDEKSYYKYGTKDNGEWIGASSCSEGKVHLNAQTWSILSDIAPPARAKQAWDAVKSRLLTEYGPLLVDPAYTVPDPTIGYITRYSPGSRENGGVYMHAATWALAAACKIKDQETVSKIWNSISPPTRGSNAAKYYAEPYVTPGNVDGPLSDKPGRAGWTWYTGSAAWMNRVSLEWILGVRPVWEGLLIDPCPPAELGKVEISRRYRGVEIHISFDATTFASDKKAILTVDGQSQEGQVIEEAAIQGARAANRPLRVQVSWGAVSLQEVDLKPISRVASV